MSALIIAAGETLAASGTRNAFGAWADDLVAEGYPAPRVNYGDRDILKEVELFTSRYRQQATGTGLYGDVRTWDGTAYGYPGGKRWVRVSAAGTVATPGASNHGRKRSADMAYPYNSNTAAHRRAQVLAKQHNITCEGLTFGSNVEWWHWTFWGALGTVGLAVSASVTARVATEAPKRKKRSTMIHAAYRDPNGTIAVQYRPRGRITLITEAAEWDGIRAATGAEANPVSAAQLKKLTDMYGTLPWPEADTAHLPDLLIRGDRNGTIYLKAGPVLVGLSDNDTVTKFSGHVQEVVWAQREIDRWPKAQLVG